MQRGILPAIYTAGTKFTGIELQQAFKSWIQMAFCFGHRSPSLESAVSTKVLARIGCGLLMDTLNSHGGVLRFMAASTPILVV